MRATTVCGRYRVEGIEAERALIIPTVFIGSWDCVHIDASGLLIRVKRRHQAIFTGFG
jgi:hypothetical protein